MRLAIPWYVDVDCCGERVNIDQNIEFYGTGKLPRKYERELERFFKTKDKEEMLKKALATKQTPIYCKKCDRVVIIETRSGDCVKNCPVPRRAGRSGLDRRIKMSRISLRVAKELMSLAKEIDAFWNMKIEPPSRTDVDRSKKVVMAKLVQQGMNCDKLAFERYMVYQENKECVGPQCKRDSNKHLCVFGFEDKDGTFGGGVAGGRIGSGNQPKLYQNWGITGTGSNGEMVLRKLIDGYIRKKTSQRDSYTEVRLAKVASESNIIERVASDLLKVAQELVGSDKTKTFECPECGTKVLENTSYCLKCKKKVKKACRCGCTSS